MSQDQREIMIKQLEETREKLLDLTLRNRLLNYRTSKVKTIEFEDVSIDYLYSKLIEEEKKLSFRSKVDDSEENDEIQMYDLFKDILASDESKESEANGSVIYVKLNKEGLKSKLHIVSRLADTFYDEQGYSILFVALGFICWKEQNNSGDLKSPLFLVPVELRRTGIGRPYRLQWTGDEVFLNECMVVKAKEMGIDFPEYAFNGESQEIRSYIEKVQRKIRKKNWVVEERCCLDFFSFSKFILWKDLDVKSWNEGSSPLDNALLKTMLITQDVIQDDHGDIEGYNHELVATEVFHILDADPSQIAVIEAVKKGKNLVVEGPPGTGKSQTIANIIAELMGLGKSILFVSEKMAALEVVKGRLEACGLGDFCLELHSRKTNKKEFINTLTNAFIFSDNPSYKIDLDTYANLESQRELLNKYARTLALTTGARGLSIFLLISLREQVQRQLEVIGRQFTFLRIPNASRIDSDAWVQIIDDLTDISLYAKNIHDFSNNLWANTDPTIFLPDAIEEFMSDLSRAFEMWSGYDSILDSLESQYGIVKQINICDLDIPVYATSLMIDLRPVGRSVLMNRLWNSNQNDPFSIIRYLREFNQDRPMLLVDEDITLEEADLRWNNLSPYVSIIRNACGSVRNLAKATGVIYDGSTAKLRDFLDACNIVAESPHPSIESLLSSKWNDLSLPQKIVELLSDIQTQYAKAKKYFPPDFLEQDHLLTIESYSELRYRRLRLLSPRYRRVKRIIKKNLVNKSAILETSFLEQLSAVTRYYQLVNELYQYDAEGKDLFGKYWQGLLSNVELLRRIVNWQENFLQMKRKGFFSEDTYTIICNKLGLTKIKTQSQKLAELSRSLDHNVVDLILFMERKARGEIVYSDLLTATLRQLKCLRLIRCDTIAKSLYGYLWNSVSTREADLLNYREWRSRFLKAIDDGLLNTKAIDMLDSPVTDNTEIQEYYRVIKTYPEVICQSKSLLGRLGIANDESDRILEGQISLHVDRLKQWIEGFPMLTAWIDYQRAKKQLRYKQCLILTDALEKGIIENPDDIVPVFEASYAETLLREEFKKHDLLSTFNGAIHEQRIAKFSQLDKRVIETNRKRLALKLGNNRPRLVSNATNHSEVGFLRSEIHKKKAHKPIRQILSKAGNLIIKAKPCFMMSPLSIAQYLDPQVIQFDTIIFDEASQVRPEDALGSLMRGRQLVVMGDSQQLPPTTFFDHIADGEQNYGDNEDLYDSVVNTESILQQSRKKIPMKYLCWHYRSKHESLIQVSNSFFYNNRLQVFPSAYARDPDKGLHFIYLPDTVYDRGKGSCNKKEAEYIVELACQHYQKNSGLSLGIAAFSVKQQEAILNELEIMLKRNPGLQPYFSKNHAEHFFVKNLETIQGDERDVIIISIGYGFDQNHQLHMSFGPLNQEGGDRRLNVLMTRAKKKCVVVSNFRASDLRITNQSSRGLRALHTFLHYAAHREMPFENPLHDTDSPFEDSVYDFLIYSGYDVVKQVGCASFRIDMAIRHPKYPSRYVLGIECDGVMYHSSRTARERDRLRQEVLENLGWQIYRIWSTDWYRNRQNSIAMLIQAVDSALRKPLEHNELITNDSEIRSTLIPSNEVTKNQVCSNSNNSQIVDIIEHTLQLKEYQLCESISLDPRYELHEMPQEILTQAVIDVVNTESPIHFDEVVTRIRSLAGLKKEGSRIRYAITEAVDNAARLKEICLRYEFLWAKDQDKVVPRHRKFEIIMYRISNEEIEEVVHMVLIHQLGTERHSLCQQVSRLLGIQRMTTIVKNTVDMVIGEMIDRGKISINAEGYVYTKRNDRQREK